MVNLQKIAFFGKETPNCCVRSRNRKKTLTRDREANGADELLREKMNQHKGQ
jgi:hypothetical protein